MAIITPSTEHMVGGAAIAEAMVAAQEVTAVATGPEEDVTLERDLIIVVVEDVIIPDLTRLTPGLAARGVTIRSHTPVQFSDVYEEPLEMYAIVILKTLKTSKPGPGLAVSFALITQAIRLLRALGQQFLRP